MNRRVHVGAPPAATVTPAVVGTAVVSLHLLLLAFNQWLIYDRLRPRIPDALRDGLAAVFLSAALRESAVELVALAAAGAIALLLAGRARAEAGHQRILAALLLSYVPITLHSLGVAGAFLAGWELDLWVASGAAATPEDVANTVRESLPFVLAPLAAGRTIATAAAAFVFAILQLFLCRLTLLTSVGSALIFAAILVGARLAA
jgi:hypothetical protein